MEPRHSGSSAPHSHPWGKGGAAPPSPSRLGFRDPGWGSGRDPPVRDSERSRAPRKGGELGTFPWWESLSVHCRPSPGSAFFRPDLEVASCIDSHRLGRGGRQSPGGPAARSRGSSPGPPRDARWSQEPSVRGPGRRSVGSREDQTEPEARVRRGGSADFRGSGALELALVPG